MIHQQGDTVLRLTKQPISHNTSDSTFIWSRLNKLKKRHTLQAKILKEISVVEIEENKSFKDEKLGNLHTLG